MPHAGATRCRGGELNWAGRSRAGGAASPWASWPCSEADGSLTAAQTAAVPSAPLGSKEKGTWRSLLSPLAGVTNSLPKGRHRRLLRDSLGHIDWTSPAFPAF